MTSIPMPGTPLGGTRPAKRAGAPRANAEPVAQPEPEDEGPKKAPAKKAAKKPARKKA